MPYRLYLALHIPFHLLQCRCNTCTNMINNDMIHFISSCDLIGSSILTSLALHHCIGPSVPSLCSSFTTTRSIAPKPPTCPSRLQLLHQAKPCLDLLHLSHMTPCHVSYAISSFITCVSFATFLSHFNLHAICCAHIYLWTNHLCISLKHILVHLRLSLNYQNQTRTFH